MKDDSKEEMAGLENAEIVRFSENSFNYGVVLIYAAALLACFGTFFFWSVNRGQQTVLAEKRQEKDAVIAEMTSPTFKEVERKASAFKSAFTGLKAADSSRYSFVNFMPALFLHIDKDVQLKTISIDTEGELSLTGTTSSYRAAADQFLALKSWPSLSDVTLGAVTFSVDKEGNGSVPVVITAKIDKTKQAENASGSSTGGTE